MTCELAAPTETLQNHHRHHHHHHHHRHCHHHHHHHHIFHVPFVINITLMCIMIITKVAPACCTKHDQIKIKYKCNLELCNEDVYSIRKETSHSCFQFQLSRLLHDNVLSISDVQVEEMKMRSNHKCMKCRTRRRKVFAVIYAKHKIAIKSRNSIYLNPESIKQYIQNCKLSRPPAIQC